MELLEKRFYYLELLHLYEELLSSTQKEVLEDYLQFDLSITEIAENRSTSRAAVEDAIKKGIKKLDEFETKLSLKSKKETILLNLKSLKDKCGDNDEIKNIEEVIK